MSGKQNLFPLSLLSGNCQEDYDDGMPTDSDWIRKQLHVQNVPLPIHQLLFKSHLHCFLQGKYKVFFKVNSKFSSR